MKKQTIYQIDTFTTTLFGGNPAAVCPLNNWLSDDLMQAIAGVAVNPIKRMNDSDYHTGR